MAVELPDYTTPDALAAHLKVPERTLKELARRIGACFVIGKSMFFTDSDVKLIMEATRPCPSNSTSAAASGTIEARLPEGGYAALLKHRTKEERSALRPKGKTRRGNVVSMDRGQR